MINDEEFEKYAEFVKGFAAEQLADGGILNAVIGVWRDAKPVAWIWPRMDNPNAANTLLMASRAVIVGADADAITLAMDTYHSTSPTRLDGVEWPRGGMQEAWESGSPDKALVSEALLVQYFDRLGDSGFRMLPYDRSGGPVVYGEPENLAGENGGYVPDNIRAFFTEPTVTDQMKSFAKHAEELDLGVEASAMGDEQMPPPSWFVEYLTERPLEAWTHQLCAVIKSVLLPLDCAIAVSTDDKEIVEIMQQSLGDLPGIKMVDTRDPDGEEDVDD